MHKTCFSSKKFEILILQSQKLIESGSGQYCMNTCQYFSGVFVGQDSSTMERGTELPPLSQAKIQSSL